VSVRFFQLPPRKKDLFLDRYADLIAELQQAIVSASPANAW
jgi:hypothetical protein